MHIRRFFQLSHRWLGLLLGLQLVLWMASGVIMSWYHFTLVTGETAKTIDFPRELAARNYASPGGAIVQVEGASEVRLKTWLGQPVYEVKGKSEIALFSALTGEKLSPITEANVRILARRDFAGEGEIASLGKTNNPPSEYRGETPVWRVDFDDMLKTRLYISPQSGEVVARRNKVWRIYDFFWMLHIMDYQERENFNNPLVRAASATGLLFAITGLVMVGFRLVGGRYVLLNKSASKTDVDKAPALPQKD